MKSSHITFHLKNSAGFVFGLNSFFFTLLGFLYTFSGPLSRRYGLLLKNRVSYNRRDSIRLKFNISRPRMILIVEKTRQVNISDPATPVPDMQAQKTMIYQNDPV